VLLTGRGILGQRIVRLFCMEMITRRNFMLVLLINLVHPKYNTTDPQDNDQ